MNNRRDFMNAGTLAFAIGANGAWALSFDLLLVCGKDG